MTQIKLQKLLYFAQGVHMVWNDGAKLFNEKIYHEKYGPVVTSLLPYLKPFANKPIDDIKDSYGSSVIINWKDEEKDELEHTLQSVYKSFGQFSAFKLVELTHCDSCWLCTKSREEIKPKDIQKSIFERYFKEAK